MSRRLRRWPRHVVRQTNTRAGVYRQKVFCVGRNKTGTTTMNTVLTDYEFRRGPQREAERFMHDHKWTMQPSFRDRGDAHETFQDAPFSNTWFLPQLHARHPGARCIPTVRDPEDWFGRPPDSTSESLVRSMTRIALRKRRNRKTSMESTMRGLLRPHYHNVKSHIKKLRSTGATRVFVISIQRTGTTSTGHFLRQVGYPTAGWKESHRNDWGGRFFNGDYEKIFKSLDFRINRAFEDGPWFNPYIYRLVFHRFPGSRFILFERDPEKWFQSMLSHSNKRTLGITHRHCEMYRRESEYYEKLDNGDEVPFENGLQLSGCKDHYIEMYNLYNRKAKDFFNENGKERLFVGKLEDDEKWEKLAEFLGVEHAGGDVHRNKTES